MNLRRALPTSALVITFVGCAASQQGQGTSTEPMLTNPPRMDAWFGGAEAPDDRPYTQRKYDGTPRVPFDADWGWAMPDPGRWEISRLELCDPLIHEDRVFVGNSRQEGLFVLDRTTGHRVKTIPTEGPVQSPPVRIDGGWLLVDTFGILQRLDDDFGVVWTYESEAAVFRAPRVAGDQVLLALSGDTVVAVGLADGQWRWSHKREVRRGSQELAILGGPRPAQGAELVFAGFSDGTVVGLDPTTGKQRWEKQVGEGKFPDIQADLLVDGDTLLVSSFSGPTVALDPASGSERWRNDDVGSAWPMLLIDGSLVVSDSRGNVHSVDAASGATEWTWALPDPVLLSLFRADQVPERAQDVSTLDGAQQAAREAAEASRRAEAEQAVGIPKPRGPGPKPNGQVGKPTRAGNLILVGDVTGTLFALDRYEGVEQWRWRPMDGTAPAGIVAAPAVAGRQMVFTTAGGRVVSLRGSSVFQTDLSEAPSKRRDRQGGW